jgi:broad specificity phosphatase PhoE
MASLKIGLVRHLPVLDMSMPSGLLTARDLIDWRDKYDTANIVDARLDPHDIPWRRCFSSDLPRAIRTAQQLFDGPIEQTPLLREPHVAEFATGNLRLPATLWHWVLRASWMIGHSSQQEARDEFRGRMKEFETSVLSSIDEDTLIVSHAGVMLFLREILTRLGFTGPQYRLAEHGKLYLFERS